MSSNRVIFACLALAAAFEARADNDPLSCHAALNTRLTSAAELAALADDLTIELYAGEFEASLGPTPTASASGGVLLRRGDKLAGADRVRFDPDTRALLLDGGVRFEDPSTQVLSDSAEFGYDSGQILFRGARFSMTQNNSRGAANEILITQEGELNLDDVSYTTCPPESTDWELLADDIDLDTSSGIGTARKIKLKFKNVPILYAPWISFPIADARKTGVLVPEIGSTGRSGNEIRVPFYWNIAPNYDATITPRLLTERGLQLQTEFRYLTKSSEGTAIAQYLPDDSQLDDARSYVNLQHRTWFSNGWRNLIDYREVSDSQYFEDLGGNLSIATTTHLNRSVSFDHHTPNLSLFMRAQDYQTLDEAIPPIDEPYRRLPQFTANGNWPRALGPVNLGIDAEIVNFDKDVGVTGWRANVAPRLALPFEIPGVRVEPAIEWDYTQYELSNLEPGSETDPSRSVPIASLDTGLTFEREITLGDSERRVQTIEPRLLYVYIPFREQSELPVFDTITPDLNLVQLFRKNRFLGVDRIGDTEQVSAGITSRLFDLSTGEELLTATIGQTYYFDDRQVTLPGQTPDAFTRSDYIAELRFLIYKNLNFDIGHQWGPGAAGTTRSEARLQYRPAANRILNLAYRYRRNSLEQGDLSWAWPIMDNWNFVGRYNYSFRDEETLEEFYGLEYESCCWGLRLVSRRFISTRDGTRDSAIGLQLVLKGMTAVGTAADKLLERGILGYSDTIR
ncbi:MAG: LPS assembly protein LptD [Pseudomonadota bacterium]